MSASLVLAYDIGGTKVSVGVVNAQGRILESRRVLIEFNKGKNAVLQQLADLGHSYLKRYPKIKKVGIASAGPLDPLRGVLLDATNFKTRGKSWGVVPLTAYLERRLKRKVFLENDAAAALLGECWKGAGKKSKNVAMLTLGTGLGTAFLCNGELQRAAHGFHTEGGHIIIQDEDLNLRCGCNNFGCAETWLSGTNFIRRIQKDSRENLHSAEDVMQRARAKDRDVIKYFELYSWHLAVSLHNFAVLFAPEIVVLAGSFAAASPFFLKKTSIHLQQLLSRKKNIIPKIVSSQLNNEAGLIGAAYVALHR